MRRSHRPPVAMALAFLLFSVNGCALLRSWHVLPPDTTLVKQDEKVIYFPTAGRRLSDDPDTWELEIAGWVSKPRNAGIMWLWSLVRIEPHTILRKPATSDDLDRFEKRRAPFFFDGVRGRQIPIHPMETAAVTFHEQSPVKCGHDTPTAEVSNGIGLFSGCVQATITHREGGDNRRVQFTAGSTPSAPGGTVHLLARHGLSIVSDIDDTIKHSVVIDRGELTMNTFYRTFTQVPEPTGAKTTADPDTKAKTMAGLYRHWETSWAAQFHYLSASPWQLYEPLAQFLRDAEQPNGFPEGTVHLRPLRFKNPLVFFKFVFGPPARYKVGVLSALMQRFPERCYVLIGDSGEQDPEAYGEIATRHPDKVGYVFIRKVKGGAPHYYDTLFETIGGLTKGKVKVFERAADLADMPKPTCGKPTES